jgi:hypothetical protein
MLQACLNILRPVFGGVEADDPDRVLILPFEHVHDDRFEIGALDVGLPEGSTAATKIVHNDVDVLIIASRHDRWRPTGFTHHLNPTPQNADSSRFNMIRSEQLGIEWEPRWPASRSFQNQKRSETMGLASYEIIGDDAEWRVLQDGKAENIYETEEAAFEAAVAAASLALRQGHEVRVSAPGRGLATGSREN